jgi:hypothetical protein
MNNIYSFSFYTIYIYYTIYFSSYSFISISLKKNLIMNEKKAIIFDFFEKPFKVKKFDNNNKEISHNNWTLICKYCRLHDIKPEKSHLSNAQDGSGLVTVNMTGSTTSNLILHFNRSDHIEVKEKYLEAKKAFDLEN